MRLFNTILLPVICAAASVGACTSSSTPGSPQSADGTKPVSATQATSSAVVTGQVDTSVSGNVQMSVDGALTPIVLAPDQSFVVRDVPTGDVKVACGADGVQGELTIKNVKQGEIIQVLVKREGDAIVIVIIQRTPSSQPPKQVSEQQGGPLVITASHACYWLEPGHTKRDVVVKGSDVHLFGAAHKSCTIDEYSILDVRLELDGDDITVFDVDLTGALVIGGHRCKVQDSCTGCFDGACEHCCGHEDESDKHLACNGGGGEPGAEEDAGAPAEDGGPAVPDAGAVTPDAGGVTPDAGCASCEGGVSRDAGAPLDASPADVRSGG
ncbi:MAG TPA: hypothetical protein VF765_00880 [Polyangiaceae bacterium]